MCTPNLLFLPHATVHGSIEATNCTPTFAEFTGGIDPIPLYDVQAA
jgi:hypothetical protein